MIKYEAIYMDALSSVNRIAVERETEASVWICGRRRAKGSGRDWTRFFDTEAEAWAWLLKKAAHKVDVNRQQLEYAEETYQALVERSKRSAAA